MRGIALSLHPSIFSIYPIFNLLICWNFPYPFILSLCYWLRFFGRFWVAHTMQWDLIVVDTLVLLLTPTPHHHVWGLEEVWGESTCGGPLCSILSVQMHHLRTMKQRHRGWGQCWARHGSYGHAGSQWSCIPAWLCFPKDYQGKFARGSLWLTKGSHHATNLDVHVVVGKIAMQPGHMTSL